MTIALNYGFEDLGARRAVRHLEEAVGDEHHRFLAEK
jgi:hypothetical protein